MALNQKLNTAKPALLVLEKNTIWERFQAPQQLDHWKISRTKNFEFIKLLYGPSIRKADSRGRHQEADDGRPGEDTTEPSVDTEDQDRRRDHPSTQRS